MVSAGRRRCRRRSPRGSPAHRPPPDGEPRRSRPRLHPREPAAHLAVDHPLVPRRGAEHGQRARARAGAAGRPTTPAATSRPTRCCSRSPSTRTSASSGPSTSSPTTWCSPRPSGQILRRYGTVTASPENAQRALDAGAALLVYPGGDWEVHRPVWERNKLDFAGRKGFVRLALDAGVPIVPVVSIGGQETALFLSHGGRLARAAARRPHAAPQGDPDLARAPLGLNVGDLLGHIPLPAKITVEVLAPIDLRAQFGDEPDVDEVYDHVTTRDAGDAGDARRRAALPGRSDRCPDETERSRSSSRPRRSSSGTTWRSPRTTCTSCRASRAGRSRASSGPGSAPATGC